MQSHECPQGVVKQPYGNTAYVQGAAIKNTPLQKSHYFQNSLIFFGELLRDYLRDILPLVLQILAFLL